MTPVSVVKSKKKGVMDVKQSKEDSNTKVPAKYKDQHHPVDKRANNDAAKAIKLAKSF